MGAPPEPLSTDAPGPPLTQRRKKLMKTISSADTMLVTVPVSVLDRQGRFIPGLKREDFTLLENGEQQPIANFETAEKTVHGSAAARYVGFHAFSLG